MALLPAHVILVLPSGAVVTVQAGGGVPVLGCDGGAGAGTHLRFLCIQTLPVILTFFKAALGDYFKWISWSKYAQGRS